MPCQCYGPPVGVALGVIIGGITASGTLKTCVMHDHSSDTMLQLLYCKGVSGTNHLSSTYMLR